MPLFITPLPNAFVAGLLGNCVNDQNHDQRNDGLEHIGCGGEGVVSLLDTDSVNVCIDDVCDIVNQCGVQHEDLVETGVNDVVAGEDKLNDDADGNMDESVMVQEQSGLGAAVQNSEPEPPLQRYVKPTGLGVLLLAMLEALSKAKKMGIIHFGDWIHFIK